MEIFKKQIELIEKQKINFINLNDFKLNFNIPKSKKKIKYIIPPTKKPSTQTLKTKYALNIHSATNLTSQHFVLIIRAKDRKHGLFKITRHIKRHGVFMSRVKGFRILKLLLIFFHLISLWWRRAVLPRRPVQFSVCFIKLYYIYTTSNINCQVLF